MVTGENIFERAKPNFEFNIDFRNKIRTVTGSIPHLSVLDQGDWEACFAFHSRFSKDEYVRALQDQGFEIVQVGDGKDIASPKFFIIARKAKFK